MADFAWGGPPVSGSIRTEPDDFQVDEQLGFEPTGEGEHLWVRIEKAGANTVWVAGELARRAGVKPAGVSFAGLKDRNARTRQWFSIHLAGRTDPPWREWSEDSWRVLSAARSARKIQRGRLRGNRFRLRIRDLDGDLDALGQRLATVSAHGVPNGFGEQRFGGNNLARAHRLFRGELRRKPSKSKRGFYLSAARSLVFNRVLAIRIERGDWNRLIDGDLAMLDGTRSVFPADPDDPEQVRRCATLDLHPTGPLAGLGDSPATGQAAAIERQVFENECELVDGLARFRMEQQRRSLRLTVGQLEWRLHGGRELELEFELPSGGYATTALRELVRYTDASSKAASSDP